MLAFTQIGPFFIEDTSILIAQILGFALFLVVVLKMPVSIPLGIPYLKQQSGERAGRIAQDLQQVDTALKDTQRLHDDYAARLRDIETEQNQRISAAVREAEAARADIIADAESAATALRRRAEEEIAREQTRQRILLRQQIVQTTLDAAEQSVVALTDNKAQRSLIQDFITRAGNGSVPVSASVASVPTFNVPVEDGEAKGV